jgi:hypothetical protein
MKKLSAFAFCLLCVPLLAVAQLSKPSPSAGIGHPAGPPASLPSLPGPMLGVPAPAAPPAAHVPFGTPSAPHVPAPGAIPDVQAGRSEAISPTFREWFQPPDTPQVPIVQCGPCQIFIGTSCYPDKKSCSKD